MSQASSRAEAARRQRRKLGSSLSPPEEDCRGVLADVRALGNEGVNDACLGEPSPVATTVTHT